MNNHVLNGLVKKNMSSVMHYNMLEIMIYLINFTIINLFQDIFHFVYLNVVWTSVGKPNKKIYFITFLQNIGHLYSS